MGTRLERCQVSLRTSKVSPELGGIAADLRISIHSSECALALRALSAYMFRDKSRESARLRIAFGKARRRYAAAADLRSIYGVASHIVIAV